jgi:hypothetical protein
MGAHDAPEYADKSSDEQSVDELIRIATRALADTPNEKLDLLDFSDYADALSAFISSERTEKPLTVGIDAAWGMGKTQLMRMVKERLTVPGGGDLNKRVRVRSSFPTSVVQCMEVRQGGSGLGSLSPGDT